MSATELAPAERLNEILMADDVSASLWAAIDSGRIDTLVPELPALRMEQDPIHRHKDVLPYGRRRRQDPGRPHRSPGRIVPRHRQAQDPKFRARWRDLRHHEVVGGRMTSKRMAALGYDESVTDQVAELVRLSGRFKGYADGWSDAAVRRYARDAGPLLGR